MIEAGKRPLKEQEDIILERVRVAVKNRKYKVTKHANQRMEEREINAPEFEYVLLQGRRDKEHDQYRDGWSYAFSGRPLDRESRIRVIIGFKEEENNTIVVIITVIDLDEED